MHARSALIKMSTEKIDDAVKFWEDALDDHV